jgi:hypothetical protein
MSIAPRRWRLASGCSAASDSPRQALPAAIGKPRKPHSAVLTVPTVADSRFTCSQTAGMAPAAGNGRCTPVMAIAKGPFMVKLEWVASAKERHPPVSYLDQLPSRATAIEKAMESLSRLQSLDLACVAAWWREVGPGESRDRAWTVGIWSAGTPCREVRACPVPCPPARHPRPVVVPLPGNRCARPAAGIHRNTVNARIVSSSE